VQVWIWIWITSLTPDGLFLKERLDAAITQELGLRVSIGYRL
jgi:hypothetical protein